MASKPAIMLALGIGKKKPDEKSKSDTSGHDDALMTAAHDILDAVKNDDASALSDALERHYQACETSGADESDNEGA